MMKKKYIAVAAVFAAIILGLGLLQLLPDKDVSAAERRKLTQSPELTAQTVFSGKHMDSLEDYLLDQFPLRDGLRGVKAALRFYVFRQADNNGVYLSNGSVFKMEYPLKDKQVLYGADKMNQVYEQYLQGMNVYYSIIPDKNYFAAQATGHLHMDYGRLTELMTENVKNMQYIDLFSVLSLEDYYRTDAHWKQESIYPAAQTLAQAMGAGATEPFESYEAHTLQPFYGVYCGQSALPVKPDELTYLTSPLTEAAAVTGIEFQGQRPVYSTELFAGMDGYDVFLSGAQAIVTIDCPQADSDRELIIFRDSFGSSIAPYFLGAYSKVTLIDLRYIASSLLEDYVEFSNQDVLFLYSTSLLNSSMLLK